MISEEQVDREWGHVRRVPSVGILPLNTGERLITRATVLSYIKHMNTGEDTERKQNVLRSLNSHFEQILGYKRPVRMNSSSMTN